MSDVSEAAKARAGELLAHVTHHDNCTGSTNHPGVCGCGLYQAFANVARYIQQVSDAAKDCEGHLTQEYPWLTGLRDKLAPLILPEPLDPLADALAGCALFAEDTDWAEAADLFRDTLEKRGLKIVESGK